jgi:predicted ATP-binding protein involved in virulence
MIERLFVQGLNNSETSLELYFNPDLNLLTGKNGSSKTTILKMIWYLNSGRFLSLIREVNFRYVELTTSMFKLSVLRDVNENSSTIKLNEEIKGITLSDANLRDLEFRRSLRIHEKLFEIQKKAIPTLFFPTFRRIEGGFSMEENFDPRYRHSDEIREALESFSRRMSRNNQRFITSISTDDIVALLGREYSSINEQINIFQKSKSDEIIKKIKNKVQDDGEILASIQNDIEEMEYDREQKLKPYTTLSDLITQIFHHKGINFSTISFGEVNNAISSDKLSAGEKQMLSFICYNAFTRNHTIFIDEPELSLHPDWQRTLVPTLLNQGSNNQFFMATHSPFIFSKYSDKEVILSHDKGE